MKSFDNIAEAKEYGVDLPSQYASELIKVGDKPFVLCNTNKVYTDVFSQAALDLFKIFGFYHNNKIHYLPVREIEEKVDVSELRDAIQEAFEKVAGYSFLDAFDTY